MNTVQPAVIRCKVVRKLKKLFIYTGWLPAQLSHHVDLAGLTFNYTYTPWVFLAGGVLVIVAMVVRVPVFSAVPVPLLAFSMLVVHGSLPFQAGPPR